jgi:hypothetical protein
MSKEDPEISENGYDLKGSTKLVGQLYPVLKAKDGEILDGVHRSEADESWRAETLKNIDSQEKKLAARLIANFHRRKVSREEKAELINCLAELYKEQGLQVNPHGSHKPNEIADRIAQVTGIHVQTVRRYLNEEFKNEAQGSGTLGKGFVSAEQAILSRIGSQQQDYGRRLLERYQDELLESPAFRARVFAMLPKNHNSGSGIQLQDEQLPPGVVRNHQGILVYKRKHGSKYVMKGKRSLPKGEGLPKLNQDETSGYFELFRESFPDCQCSSCAHWKECDVAVQPDE